MGSLELPGMVAALLAGLDSSNIRDSGRQKRWIKVKNRKHPAMGRVLDSHR